MEKIKVSAYRTSWGEMILGSLGDKLCLCDWMEEARRDRIDRRIRRRLNAEYEEEGSDTVERAIVQLNEYFEGSRRSFDIPLLFTGSAFQVSVWEELLKIPYGSTISYAELACRIERPKAFRAVASANGANAISIFVPCHRVIGSNGELGGYAGGLAAKEGLLALEDSSALKY